MQIYFRVNFRSEIVGSKNKCNWNTLHVPSMGSWILYSQQHFISITLSAKCVVTLCFLTVWKVKDVISASFNLPMIASFYMFRAFFGCSFCFGCAAQHRILSFLTRDWEPGPSSGAESIAGLLENSKGDLNFVFYCLSVRFRQLSIGWNFQRKGLGQ